MGRKRGIGEREKKQQRPKSKTLNSKPETSNPKPKTLNLKPKTSNPKLET
jgi:hypothetical protein